MLLKVSFALKTQVFYLQVDKTDGITRPVVFGGN